MVKDMDIEFRLNLPRMLETICWFANNGDDGKIDMHSLMKILFFADVKHMDGYNMPILGGRYIAMKFGPVHSEIYQTLKNNFAPIDEARIELPFSVDNYCIIAHRQFNEMKMSEANMICLRSAWQEHRGKSFNELTDLSHQHMAWRNAWGRGSEQSYSDIMKYEDFFTGKVEADIIDDLRTHGLAIAV